MSEDEKEVMARKIYDEIAEIFNTSQISVIEMIGLLEMFKSQLIQINVK